MILVRLDIEEDEVPDLFQWILSFGIKSGGATDDHYLKRIKTAIKGFNVYTN